MKPVFLDKLKGTYGIEIEVGGIEVDKGDRLVASQEKLGEWVVVDDGSIPSHNNDNDACEGCDCWHYEDGDPCDCHEEGCCHCNYDEEGSEYRSPIFGRRSISGRLLQSDKKTYAEIETILALLKIHGGFMAKNSSGSTGLHVHVGEEDRDREVSLATVKVYGYFEKVIDEFHHETRRGNDCNWSRSIQTYAKAKGVSLSKDSSWTDKKIVNVWDYNKGRYVNREIEIDTFYQYRAERYTHVHPNTGHGTTEYRQAFGTFNAVWAWNWITFCRLMIHCTREGNGWDHLEQTREGLTHFLTSSITTKKQAETLVNYLAKEY